MHAEALNALELRLLHRIDQHVKSVDALELRLKRLESAAVEAVFTQSNRVISIVAAMEEHLHIASVALLHSSLVDSTMKETVLTAEAMRLAYRLQEDQG